MADIYRDSLTWTGEQHKREAFQILKDDRKLYLRLLAVNPIFFVRELFEELGPPVQVPLEDLDLEIIHFAFLGRDLGADHRMFFPRRGVLCTRGWGKTTFLVAGQSAWRHFNNAETRIKAISKTPEHATNTVIAVREWYEQVWFLQHLAPDKAKRQRRRDDDFDVGPIRRTKDPSISARSITQQITGTRAGLCCPDDIETPENTRTHEARERLAEITPEFHAIASFEREEVCVVGTIWHDETVYARLQEQGYELRTYPIAVPALEDQFINLAPCIQKRLDSGELKYTTDGNYEDNPLFPHRFGTSHIIEFKKSGVNHFMRQRMLVRRVTGEARYPLRIRDLIVPDFQIKRDEAPVSIAWGMSTGGQSTAWKDFECIGLTGDALYRQIHHDERWGRFNEIVCWFDPAGVGEDQCAYAIVGHLAGYFWVKHIGSFPPNTPPSRDMYDTVAADCKFHGARKVYVEDWGQQITVNSFLQESLNALICREGEEAEFPDGWACQVIPAHLPGTKEDRIIDTLEPVMNQHRLVVAPQAIKTDPTLKKIDYELQYQLANIIRLRKCLQHYDKLESLASAVFMLMPQRALDPKTAAKRASRAQEEATIKAFNKRYRENQDEIYKMLGPTKSKTFFHMN